MLDVNHLYCLTIAYLSTKLKEERYGEISPFLTPRLSTHFYLCVYPGMPALGKGGLEREVTLYPP